MSFHEKPLDDAKHEVKLGVDTEALEHDELLAAIAATHVPTWSKSSIKLYLCIFCACCCAFANGFDGSLFTAILAMPHFQKTFNVETTGPKIGAMSSLYTVGSMVFAPLGAVLSDKFGRRKAMFMGSWVIILGMVLGATANHAAQFMVARFVLGGGINIMTVAAPAYSMEVAPPQWRGRASGIYNCGWFGGSIPAAIVTFGCNYINSNLQWRLPVVFQAVACSFVIVLVFFLPESPRFMMAQGDVEGAHAFLTEYHGNGDPNAPLVLFELKEMQASITTDGADKRWWDYRPLFATRSGGWRMMQVLMISIFGQFSGNGLGYFITVIYDNIGIHSVPQQLAYNIINQVVSAFCALTAASLTDRMPRRAILPAGTFMCAVLLAINAGLSTVLDQKTVIDPVTEKETVPEGIAKGALAAFFLFNCMFSFTYTPLQGVIPVESLSTNMRAKGLAASGFIVSAVGFINQFAGPIGLGNLGYRYIWIFVGWDCVEAVCWYLFGVEGQGRSLEELDWIYEQPNPVKASKLARKHKIIATDNGFVMAQ